MAETMALRAGDGSTGSTTPLGDFDLRRWGDDAVMTEDERDEWRMDPGSDDGDDRGGAGAANPPPRKKAGKPKKPMEACKQTCGKC